MELKPTPTSPKVRQNTEIEKLYRDKNFTELHRPGPRNSRTFIILVAVVVGVFSGFFGSIFFYFLFPGQLSQLNPITFRSARGSELTPEKIIELRENIQPGLINFYVKKNLAVSTDPRGNLYHPWEQLATGFAVTSDGWVVAPRYSFSDLSAEYIAQTSDGKIYEIQKIMADPASSLYFLKIEVKNLPVVDFAATDDIFAGDQVFIVVNNGQTVPVVYPTYVTQLQHVSYTSNTEYIESSDVYRNRALLHDSLTADFQGAVAINGSGKVLGLVSATSWPSNELVLGYQIKPGLSSLLKNGQVERSVLGVHYLDLSRKTNYPPTSTEGIKNGALIFGDREANRPAIVPGSPAEKVGLEKGDVIVKVGDTILDEQHNLTDVIQDYSAGEIVKLKVVRAAKEITLEVTLTAQK